MSDTTSTMEVGKRLVELCRQGKHVEAVNTLYSPTIVSIEAGAGPNMSPRTDGIDAVRAKGEWWVANHEVHGGNVEGPWPHGDRFIVRFTYDITAKVGP